jgi:hypothetical protein
MINFRSFSLSASALSCWEIFSAWSIFATREPALSFLEKDGLLMGKLSFTSIAVNKSMNLLLVGFCFHFLELLPCALN